MSRLLYATPRVMTTVVAESSIRQKAGNKYGLYSSLYDVEREAQRYDTYTAAPPGAIIDKNGAVTCGGVGGGRGEENVDWVLVCYCSAYVFFLHRTL